MKQGLRTARFAIRVPESSPEPAEIVRVICLRRLNIPLGVKFTTETKFANRKVCKKPRLLASSRKVRKPCFLASSPPRLLASKQAPRIPRSCMRDLNLILLEAGTKIYARPQASPPRRLAFSTLRWSRLPRLSLWDLNILVCNKMLKICIMRIICIICP